MSSALPGLEVVQFVCSTIVEKADNFEAGGGQWMTVRMRDEREGNRND
jgi:hypothetical protein